MPIPAHAHHRADHRAQLRPLRRRRRGPAADRRADPVLRPLPAARRRPRQARPPTGLEGVLRKSSRSRATTRRSRSSTSSTSSASRATTRTSAASCGSPTAGRSASGCACARQTEPRRGRGLPRRHADHDRRRRVHHQRRRARRRQPAAPLARASTSSSRREADKELHSCRIIPERGSWIEINVTKKDTLGVRIDQSGKFSRHDAACGRWTRRTRRRADIIREFYEPETVKLKDAEARARLVGDPEKAVPPMVAVGDVIDPETGEVYVERRRAVHRGRGRQDRRRRTLEGGDPSWPRRRTRSSSSSLDEDGDRQRTRRRCSKIYQRLRPGQPAAAREGQGAVPGEVPGPEPLPPRPRRPLPHQPQVRPERPRDAR